MLWACHTCRWCSVRHRHRAIAQHIVCCNWNVMQLLSLLAMWCGGDIVYDNGDANSHAKLWPGNRVEARTYALRQSSDQGRTSHRMTDQQICVHGLLCCWHLKMCLSSIYAGLLEIVSITYSVMARLYAILATWYRCDIDFLGFRLIRSFWYEVHVGFPPGSS